MRRIRDGGLLERVLLNLYGPKEVSDDGTLESPQAKADRIEREWQRAGPPKTRARKEPRD